MPHDIKYSIKTSKRAKYLRIVVNCDAVVSVVSPKGFSLNMIDKVILEKADWIKARILHFKKIEKLKKPIEIEQGSFYACNARAKKFVKERVEYFNQFYKFEYNKISIKRQSTRWGSCSSKKNLNFNYKILFLPKELVDYIVVHELCHLKEMNHARSFWNLVGQVIPDYKKRVRDLKKINSH